MIVQNLSMIKRKTKSLPFFFQVRDKIAINDSTDRIVPKVLYFLFQNRKLSQLLKHFNES